MLPPTLQARIFDAASVGPGLSPPEVQRRIQRPRPFQQARPMLKPLGARGHDQGEVAFEQAVRTPVHAAVPANGASR